eukprot:jgi/Botrbrau1/1507/Bobra.178_3s0059.1
MTTTMVEAQPHTLSLWREWGVTTWYPSPGLTQGSQTRGLKTTSKTRSKKARTG